MIFYVLLFVASMQIVDGNKTTLLVSSSLYGSLNISNNATFIPRNTPILGTSITQVTFLISTSRHLQIDMQTLAKSSSAVASTSLARNLTINATKSENKTSSTSSTKTIRLPPNFKHIVILVRMEYISRGLSFAFALISLIALVCLRLPNTTKFFVHRNLLVAFLFADGLVLIGHPNIQKRLVNQKAPCTFLTITYYYFGLTLFSWMLIEAVQIIIMLVQVFDTRSKFTKHLLFSLVGWGTPVVITIISVGIKWTVFKTSRNCNTLSELWIYRSPVAVYLSLNALAFLYIIFVVTTKIKSSTKYGGSWKKVLRTVRSILVLYPVLGMSFLFGFFLDNTRIVISYFFVIFNGFLGVLFFVFHCALDEQVQQCFMKDVVGRLPKAAMSSIQQRTRQTMSNTARSSLVEEGLSSSHKPTASGATNNAFRSEHHDDDGNCGDTKV